LYEDFEMISPIRFGTTTFTGPKKEFLPAMESLVDDYTVDGYNDPTSPVPLLEIQHHDNDTVSLIMHGEQELEVETDEQEIEMAETFHMALLEFGVKGQLSAITSDTQKRFHSDKFAEDKTLQSHFRQMFGQFFKA